MYIDTLIKIKNAEQAQKKSVKIRFTKLDNAIIQVLTRYGFLKKSEIKGRAPKRMIEVIFNPDRPINGLKLISRPSVKRYGGYDEFRSVKNGEGILVVSTSKGILSGVEARKNKVGGQLLFEIW